MNGNGHGAHHVETDAYLAGIMGAQQSLAIYTVEIYIVDETPRNDVETYQIIAESMTDALARAQKIAGVVEVMSIQKLPGMVLR